MAILHHVTRSLGALIILAFLAVPARAQTETRFNVTSVGDSTLNFSIGTNTWVAQGQKGIVVDPRRQDVLIARIAILAVSGSTATALITGQTTTVQTAHVAVLERPPTRIYKRSDFWIGLLIGAVAGFAGASAL
jgi:hypothetical protein